MLYKDYASDPIPTTSDMILPAMLIGYYRLGRAEAVGLQASQRSRTRRVGKGKASTKQALVQEARRVNIEGKRFSSLGEENTQTTCN